MKVLVAGCGSIGRRHISTLIDSDRIEQIAIYTQNKDCLEGLNDKGKVLSVNAIDHVNADFAVIANDTHRHIDTALQLADRGIHLFIEKPLSHNLDNIDALKERADQKGVKIYIGYNLRFLGILQQIRTLLRETALGDLYFGRIEVGQYLPQWRKGTDYRKSYSASNERGGGVALDLSHEIDYMRYLFGDPVSWKVMRSRTGTLEMDAEDMFEGMYLYQNGSICSVHMDCLQKKPNRCIRIEGSRGTLFCDIIGKKMTVVSDGAEQIINDEGLFDVNRTYRDEMAHFMDVVENRCDPAVTLDDGTAVLRLIHDR